ncbi:MAG: acetylglutamate kinase [Eubacteriaceae bacterium]|jgi:acetylglutamate kinase|nr:acetylglutamate kinase [Eubacteriaceae bacterium]
MQTTDHKDALSTQSRSEVLIQALPYIQKYYSKIVVVKFGGSAMSGLNQKKQVMSDLVLLSLVGMKVVLVHGGGPEITQMLTRLGRESKFVDGLRVTDRDSAEVATMVLAGKVNKELVGLIGNIGGKAVGLCGIDGGILASQKLDDRLGFVGTVEKTDPQLILDLLEHHYIPVVSSIGFDREGNTYNVNADTAASEIAASLKAESLILMTDTPGILRDRNDPSSLIRTVAAPDAEALIACGTVDGGMIPKVRCCVLAAAKGVKRVFIIDGRVDHAVLIELLTDEGIGTMFVGSPPT